MSLYKLRTYYSPWLLSGEPLALQLRRSSSKGSCRPWPEGFVLTSSFGALRMYQRDPETDVSGRRSPDGDRQANKLLPGRLNRHGPSGRQDLSSARDEPFGFRVGE